MTAQLEGCQQADHPGYRCIQYIVLEVLKSLPQRFGLTGALLDLRYLLLFWFSVYRVNLEQLASS